MNSNDKNMSAESAIIQSNFIHNIIDEDLKKGTYGQKVYTRFPP